MAGKASITPLTSGCCGMTLLEMTTIFIEEFWSDRSRFEQVESISNFCYRDRRIISEETWREENLSLDCSEATIDRDNVNEIAVPKKILFAIG